MRGVIVRVLYDKGFGFIKDEEGNVRFMHAFSLVDQEKFGQLQPGQPVDFQPVHVGTEGKKVVGPRDNGLRAELVRVL
jgi:cold shock CspA family protein